MNGASWADEIRSSSSHTDRADATSNNNYVGEYSSLDVATGTLSNNGTQPPSTSHIKKSPIKLVRAGDEPKNPAAFFALSSRVTRPILSTTNTRQIRKHLPTLNEPLLHNIFQNDTSHHAPNRLKKSDESEPGDNDDDSVDFLCHLYTEDDFDTEDDDSDTTNAATNIHVTVPERSGLGYEQKRLINALEMNPKRWDTLPNSPSIRPAVIEKILGETGLDGKLVLAAGGVMSSNNENSQFDSSIKGQLGCFLQLELENIGCDAQLRDAQLRHIIKEINGQRHIGQVAIELIYWIYNGGPVISLERMDALKSMQLLRYATIETYKRATEKQRKEGDICSPQISSTVMKFYRYLRRIALVQGKDVS